MRLLICAGGTGGGVYPALAILRAVEHCQVALELTTLWVGGKGGMEAELVKREGIPYMDIPAAGVHGVGLRTLPGNLSRLVAGFSASRRILAQFHPDVLLFTGGYLAVPMALAARAHLRSARPHTLLYIPDIEPGLALQTLTRFADHIALTTESSRSFLPAKVSATVTGYPLRSELKPWTREAAFQALGLAEHLPVLLVSGGSRGARSINRALMAALPDLLDTIQVVHIAGQRDWSEVENFAQTLPAEKAARYHAYPYLHAEMAAALSIADLALSRAGASTLGEYPLFGLPAILVPYPFAWRYQRTNAAYLAQQGAAVIVEDAELPEKLAVLVKEIIGDRSRLEQMRRSMRALARLDAAREIAGLVKQLAT